MPKIKVADKPTVDEILALLTGTEAGLTVLKGLITTIKNDVATTKTKATDAVNYLTNSTYGLNALKTNINNLSTTLSTMNTTLNTVNNNVTNVSGGGGGITPDNIKQLEVTKPDNSDSVTITFKTPDDTIIDGHRLCNVLGAKVIKKVGSYPVNEKDGKVVIDAAIGPNATKTYTYTETDYKYAYIYYRAFAYSDQYTFNRSVSNPSAWIRNWIICNNEVPLECVRISERTTKNFYSIPGSPIAYQQYYWMDNMYYRDEITITGLGQGYDTDKILLGDMRKHYKNDLGYDLVFSGEYGDTFNNFSDSVAFYSDDLYIYTKKKFNTKYLKGIACKYPGGSYGAIVEGIPSSFHIYGSDSIPANSDSFNKSQLFNPFSVSKEVHLVFNHPRSRYFRIGVTEMRADND